MLAWLGVPFRVQPADLDETQRPGEAPADYVTRLARAKALSVSADCHPGEWVLAADTTVADGNAVLGTPADPADAKDMMTRLRGREHQVYTALTLLQAGGGARRAVICQSPVRMRPYSDSEMHAYIKSGDPLDKAGAYGIQHAGFHPVEGFEHCFANVMGLPLCHLRVLLQGVMDPQTAVALPDICRSQLGYDCRFSAAARADAAVQVRMDSSRSSRRCPRWG